MSRINAREGQTYVLKAGTYFIADPCYSIPTENIPTDQWDHVLQQSGFFCDTSKATFETYKGSQGSVLAFSTLYGDGSYEDEYGNRYGVDSGLIGAILLSDIDPAKFNITLGAVHTFDTDVKCIEIEGILYFGDVCINTN